MKLKVEKGRGYQPVALATSPTKTTGPSVRLQLDASFSPIAGLLPGESARVEQRTDLDKLIIQLETNGTIDPEEAIRSAAKILLDQLSVFVDLEGKDEVRPQPATSRYRSYFVAAGGRSGVDSALR